VFLPVGLRYGERAATRDHPFGYGKAQFFYAFLVSVMLFGIAGWAALSHGYEALRHGETAIASQASLLGYEFPGVWVNYVVLVGAIGFESYAFAKAWAETKRQMARHEWESLREMFRRTSDMTTLTALTEDTVALLGLVFALVGILLTQLTENPVYDAASALLIGVLLMVFAAALAWENKRLLLGESLPPEDERELRAVVEESPGVVELTDFRSVYFGPNELLVTVDVAFREDMDSDAVEDAITSIVEELKASSQAVAKVYVEPQADA
jgi:cation diffusion facilitator family transporter